MHPGAASLHFRAAEAALQCPSQRGVNALMLGYDDWPMPSARSGGVMPPPARTAGRNEPPHADRIRRVIDANNFEQSVGFTALARSRRK
jgi:hypothetical protein